MINRSRADALSDLPAAGVPAAAINDIAEAFDLPQVKHRGGRIDLPHQTAGTAPGIANPMHFSASPVVYRNAPPLLGEHTDEVLEQLLDIDSERRAELRRGAIID